MKQTNCRLCNKEFVTNTKRKYYCSKECHDTVRKAKHLSYTRELYRKRSGVYQKWITELRSVGYVVVNARNTKYHSGKMVNRLEEK